MKYDIENNKEKTILSHTGHFTLVNLLKKIFFNHSVENEFIKDFLNQLSELIIANFSLFINSKGAFIILVLYENEYYGEKIRSIVKDKVKDLTKILKENPKSKAIEILVNKINKK